MEPTHHVVDYIAAARLEAERDAHRLGLVLRTLGLRGTPEKPLRLPRSFLLELAAALRLLSLEEQDFVFPRDAGMPEGMQALHDAFQSPCHPAPDAEKQFGDAIMLTLRHFAWHGLRDLGADVALDALDGDEALDALAEFLWRSRHAGTLDSNRS